MEAFPAEFTLESAQRKLQAVEAANIGEHVPKLRKLFYENITAAISGGYKAAMITVDNPVNYPHAARKAVSAEVSRRFPKALYAHQQLERLDIDEFSMVDAGGDTNFEFLVVLDPDFKPWPADGNGGKAKISAEGAYTLCKTKIGS